MNELFENFKRWIRGEIRCTKCEEVFHLLSFGFGEGLCPNCFGGEDSFVQLDETYWLNRWVMRIGFREVVVS